MATLVASVVDLVPSPPSASPASSPPSRNEEHASRDIPHLYSDLFTNIVEINFVLATLEYTRIHVLLFGREQLSSPVGIRKCTCGYPWDPGEQPAYQAQML
ncbi:hypothetical protein BDR22DRAFT_819847 [Usnea florida]